MLLLTTKKNRHEEHRVSERQVTKNGVMGTVVPHILDAWCLGPSGWKAAFSGMAFV